MITDHESSKSGPPVSIFHNRVRTLNNQSIRRGARYVLYWCQMNRRADSNLALEFAVKQANALKLPVLVYEAVDCAYPYANDRIHTFFLEGVPEMSRRLAARGLGYVFYLRRNRQSPNDVLYRLAGDAALVVTDDYPVFVTRVQNQSVAPKIGVPYIAVESSCVVPPAVFGKKEYGAYTLRPKLHRVLSDYLRPVFPIEPVRPWAGELPEFHTEVAPGQIPAIAASCEIDHSVPPSICFKGGRLAAEGRLAHFVEHNLARYASDRNEPCAHATSDLSPYLHFGCISAIEVALAARGAPEFLEELIVRRELAFNHAWHAPVPDSIGNLPDWARATLAKHASDPRDFVYTRDQFEHADTHDELWNACQQEMLLRGKIHGYYRMYWGKKIVEWSTDPEEAVRTMVHIHDKYALDGRDPNTYTNILWCLGLHDRPWQERPVFGMVRYMNLAGMRRKTDVDAYLREIRSLQSGQDLHAQR